MTGRLQYLMNDFVVQEHVCNLRCTYCLNFENENLKPGKPFCEVADPHQVEAHMILDQSDIDLVRLDRRAWIKIYGDSEITFRSHVSEIDREIARLTALRAELAGMLAIMPGPACPDPAPGTWCAPDFAGEEGGDRNVLVLR